MTQPYKTCQKQYKHNIIIVKHNMNNDKIVHKITKKNKHIKQLNI